MGSGGGGQSVNNQLNRVGDWINTQLGVTEGSLGDAINRGNPNLEANLANAGGEISGANSQRQRDWQKQVAADAESARLKDIKDKNLAAQTADVAASNTAMSLQKKASSSANNGSFFNWRNPGGPDVTDFLGL